jgi:MFS family permease
MKRNWRESWVWLLALFTLATFLETVFWGQVSAFTPLFLPVLGLPAEAVPRWTGLIAALVSVVGLPFLPLWGALADRFARQPIIIRSFVVHLAAGALAMVAGNVWVFALARAIMSLSLGNSGLMMTTLAERAPANRQGLAFAVMNGAGPVGIFLGPLVGGPIVDTWGFRALMALNVGLMLGVVLALALGYTDCYRGQARGSVLSMAWESVRVVGGSAALRALFLALLTLFAGWQLALTYLPVAVGSLYQGDDPGTAVGAVLGAGGLLAMLVGPVAGSVADRWGFWRVLLGGAALAVGLWPLPALAGDLVRFGAAWALVNAVFSSSFAVSFNVLANTAPANIRGRVMAFAYLPINLGGLAGPLLGSLLLGRGPADERVMIVFPVAAGITVLAIALLLSAWRVQRRAAA